MKQEMAETIGLQALGWLAGNDDLLPVFLGSTGGDVGALREGAGDPQFLAAVLDFITMDDAWVVAFCDASGLDYAQPMQARQALPGGGEVNWT
ncbi:uncharacterized protein DUF3572 [Maritimibacter alkaliphilus HTCC2654]|jgi:hypothetical protein|uniref:DUF3572 domain-containing protein n=1 Tax=Maritimibacter alkaliphilus HTCC2654 TaxID=314271 RepID=A3VLX8_9RHOB|nr:DUF3572 domain-containing protein [Maritimibacter alkaliphilus]EAQ10733.1 hypothetical protein RB2654_21088 [Rhodobacterales bacterium HTCC2654] [Maritimibacter alkaliphilus HTCC2654]TYP78655.1 uncharacterized protein DUF3572 [Maritimibacter alkaliphilus HTCC2654]